MPTRKILYSPGYGAGWTTWNDGNVANYMLTYQPIIDFLEAGNHFSDADMRTSGARGDAAYLPLHPLLRQLREECKEKFDKDYVCVLGADGLRVVTVSGRVRLHEYDGSESYEEEGEYEGWR